MSVFNPQVPGSQDPNYLNYAKVIDAPAPDQSSALAIKAAGDSLESGVGIVDHFLKEKIKDSATTEIDKRRDAYTAGLEKLKEQTASAPGIIPSPVQTSANTTTGSGSLLDANASMDVPDGVEQGLDRITQLDEARKAAKINDTQYSMEVLSIAKRLRAQYGSGYRDYIDTEVSKISGLPVANSYYQNLVTDINRQLVQTAGQKDRIEALYLKNLRVPNIVQSFAQYKAGNMTQEAFIRKIADWENLENKTRMDQAARTDARAERGEGRAERGEIRSDRADTRAENSEGRAASLYSEENVIKDQTKRLTSLATDTVQFHLKDVNALSNMESLPSLVKYFEDSSAGNIKTTDAEVQQRIGQLAAYRNVVYSRLVDKASGYAAVIGNDTADKIIGRAMAPLDTFIAFAKDKETGPAFFQARQMTALTDQAKLDFMINKDTYAANKQLIGARNILGEQYFPDWIRGIISNTKIENSYRGIFEQEALSAVQPYEDKRGQPVQRIMKDAIQHGKSIEAPPEYHGGIINLVKTIGDPKAPLKSKDELINWAFNPNNVGRLNELKTDYRDPRTGQMVPGKWAAFDILSSDAIVQGVKDTAKVKPENYRMFQGTLEQEFGGLVRTDIQNLNAIIAKPYLNVHFSWNSETKELGLVDKSNRPITRDERALGIEQPNKVYLNSALDILGNVNKGLRNLSNVQKNSLNGGDIDTYLFKTLADIRFNPEAITGVRADILKSIFKTRNPDATPEDLNNMIKKVNP